LVGFTNSACDEELDPYRLRTRIISKEFIGDTLSISIGMVGNCGVDFVPYVDNEQDTILLRVEEIGIPDECLCCYELNFRLYGIIDMNASVKFNSKVIISSSEMYKTYPVKYIVFKGDTTGYIDKYGLKQGVYIQEHKGMQIERHIKDDEYVKFKLRDEKGSLVLESAKLTEIYELANKLCGNK